MQTVCRSGARLAQPGEFTLRAFLAGRIDLTQAEAVLGVIDAADRNQLQVALGQLAGGLARPLQQLRSDLLDLLADLEAGLDFVEDDIRFVAPDELSRRLAAAAQQIDDIAKQLSGPRYNHRPAASGAGRLAKCGEKQFVQRAGWRCRRAGFARGRNDSRLSDRHDRRRRIADRLDRHRRRLEFIRRR